MNLKSAWLKTLVRYPVDIRRSARCLQESAFAASEVDDLSQRPIVVEMHTPQLLFDCGRHLNCIAQHARQIGSPFFLRCNRLLLAAVSRKLYGRELLSDPHVIWQAADTPNPRNAIVLTDNASRSRAGDAIEMLIGRDAVHLESSGTPNVMPYPMHHRTSQAISQDAIAKLQRNDKRSGLFFAGRLKNNYRASSIESDFGVMNRIKVVQTIRDHCQDRIATQLARKRSDKATKPVTLLDSAQTSIEPGQWLETLAGYNFFLACPGVCQPMCHNVIEAMAVGTIPVLQYADRFTPELQPWDAKTGQGNAITFTDEASLRGSVDQIEAMNPTEIAMLRTNVIRHYQQHLCSKRFLQTFRDAPVSDRPKMISMPFHSENYFTHRRAEKWRQADALNLNSQALAKASSSRHNHLSRAA